jgi:primosomal replication protein N
MRHRAFAFLTLGIALVGVVAPVLTHHSFSAEFDSNKPVTLTGTVTKVAWQNPHVWFYMNVVDKTSKKTVNYGFELGPPHLLQGGNPSLTKDTIKIGSTLTVEGSLAKNGSNNVNAQFVVTKDGTRLSGRSSRNTTP